eukprot:CAMPEP_0173387544 /NCGR_PEP_ID=MMETSP1356-20130122/10037_1 /TAXON_ID=77927 ORGANISM="Hemiselmis virescens, Strain PCC157" /NCGR_SAMPLE_ID=MMETSP1356 /ASSEMBLY_ACC=CAM_ASM_000847 /LENGTH=155 /DNA_ID=CAMNT_0014344193 /DNA_START=569 /DNA_END=1032 /DNA_ORIENTATION=-
MPRAVVGAPRSQAVGFIGPRALASAPPRVQIAYTVPVAAARAPHHLACPEGLARAREHAHPVVHAKHPHRLGVGHQACLGVDAELPKAVIAEHVNGTEAARHPVQVALHRACLAVAPRAVAQHVLSRIAVKARVHDLIPVVDLAGCQLGSNHHPR